MNDDVSLFLKKLGIDSTNFSLEEVVQIYKTFLIDMYELPEVDISLLNYFVSMLTKLLMEVFEMESISSYNIQKYIARKHSYLMKLKSENRLSELNSADQLYMVSTLIAQRLIQANLEDFCGVIISSMYENACFVDSFFQEKDVEKGKGESYEMEYWKRRN